MSNIIVFQILILTMSSSYEYALKELGTFPGIYKYKNKTEAIETFKCELKNPKNERHNILIMEIKKDLKKIGKFNKIKIEQFEKLLKTISDFQKSKTGIIENSELFFIKNCQNFIKDEFGKESYTDMLITQEIIIIEMENKKENDFRKLIDDEILRFEKSIWKSSPELTSYYMIKCAELKKHNIFIECYECAKKIEAARLQIVENPESTALVGPISYELGSLCGLKKYELVIDRYKEISSGLLETESKYHHHGIAEIYASVAESYYYIQKKELACIYQEMALGKMYSCHGSRTDPSVLKAANKLQFYFANSGKWNELRSLEERYNLKPLTNSARGK